MNHKNERNVDCRERLEKLKKYELQALAAKLNLENVAGKRKDELKALIVEKRTPEEIEASLGIQPEKPRKKWTKTHTLISVLGSIASIIALIIVFFPVQTDSGDLTELKKEIRKKIPDPLIIKEYEKKLEETEKALKQLKEGDKKAREEALAAYRKGDFSRAEELYENLRKKEKLKQKEYAETAYNLGNVYFLQLKYKKALDSYLEADRLDPGNAEYKNSIGVCYYWLGKYWIAGEYFETCLELNRKAYGDEHGNVATSWNNLGSAHKALGRYETAIQYYQKALDIDIKIYGESHPDVAIDWNNLGEAYRALGRYETAIQYHKKALDLRIKIYGESHPDVATSWNNLGGAYYSLGRYETAIKYYKKALHIFEKFLGKEHPSTKTVGQNLEMAEKRR